MANKKREIHNGTGACFNHGLSAGGRLELLDKPCHGRRRKVGQDGKLKALSGVSAGIHFFSFFKLSRILMEGNVLTKERR